MTVESSPASGGGAVWERAAAHSGPWSWTAAITLILIAFAPSPVESGLVSSPSRNAGAAVDTLRLCQAQATALAANPAIRSARLRADAAAERISPAGALPDPGLSLGLMNRPLDDLGAAEPMTMNTIEVMQRFPWPGKRGYAQGQARHLATAAELGADEEEARLMSSVASVYFDLGYVDRAMAVMEDTRSLLQGFLEVSLALYAVGDAVQQDVLQAQVAVAHVTEDITVLEQERVAVAARLNGLMGRDATTPIPAVELHPPGPPPPSSDSLMTLAVRSRPALSAARARVLAAEAAVEEARRAAYPDLTVTLGYGHRPEFTDMATLMVGMSVPLWAGSRQGAQRREMEALRAAEEAGERDLHNQTFVLVTELAARAERARRLSGLYESSVLPQARAAVESALSAYRVGRIEFTTLVDSQMTVNRYQTEAVKLAAEYHQALAELRALVGQDLGGDQ